MDTLLSINPLRFVGCLYICISLNPIQNINMFCVTFVVCIIFNENSILILRIVSFIYILIKTNICFTGIHTFVSGDNRHQRVRKTFK